MPRETPDFRATVRPDGAIRLVPGGPALVTGGPLLAMLRARAPRGLVIADLTVERDDAGEVTDVSVTFLLGDEREPLADWAADVGYRRIWFPDEVIDLEPTPPLVARVRCTSCRTTMEDGAVEFWEHVRQAGAFPSMCVLCGGDLPQWTVEHAWQPGASTLFAASDRRADERLS